MTLSVTDNANAHRFELAIDDDVAFIDYRIEPPQEAAGSPPVYVLEHTEVPESLGGRGVGGQLVAGALAHIRDTGAKVRSECSFVTHYLSRHGEYNDLVAA
ncbi:MAG: GNAT family N-acetyltransferase [Pseudochelatococcus sp.]|jgi:predicted GNAT family acetyltransferase|uniref:GNAT family N-acetyltransferase n=1 Tax=Pseudochelatococcus sp. TaxID=2020869 RepID=UPI003D8C2B6D